MPEGIENEGKPAGNSGAGETVRAARIAAGVDLAKLSGALRISPDALEALEAGQYSRLPGEPYVRALLGSIARYLGLDPQKLLQTYNAETGAKSPDLPARPYTDSSQVHILAHKKWFIALLAVLLIALLIIFGKINSSSENSAPVAAPSPHDTATSLVPPTDSIPENKSLQPDSLNGKLDTTRSPAVIAKTDTVRKVVAGANNKAHDSVAKAPAAPPPAPSAATPGMNRVAVKALVDSVWMRVLRHGKPEEVVLLRLGKPPVEVAHTDTIVLILGKRHSVELTLGDSTFVPSRKRFKLSGKKITYF